MESQEHNHPSKIIDRDLIVGAQRLTDPITAILGYAQLLLKSTQLPQEDRLHVLVIEREAHSMATQLEALLSTLSDDRAAPVAGTVGSQTSAGASAETLT